MFRKLGPVAGIAEYRGIDLLTERVLCQPVKVEHSLELIRHILHRLISGVFGPLNRVLRPLSSGRYHG
ncbi:hypothetical protein GCM10007392_09160 [Saccharospirillum salsuginis]|uniref:Uncharacterized protein n=1 Tax=Saccharospirillum salsuginis TaxID=418750 RepID=A0A918N7L6_9GAMM|nr:hypothetical protein GCM10007392_09160 [Saccharospirillum salsuginis]